MKKILLSVLFFSVSFMGFAATVSNSCGPYKANAWTWDTYNCNSCYWQDYNYTTKQCGGLFTEYNYSLCRSRVGDDCRQGGGFLRAPNNNGTFFNLRERTTPTRDLQVRGALQVPISVTNADMHTMLQPGKVHLLYYFKQNYTPTMDIGIVDSNNPQTWALPTTLGANIATSAAEHFILPSDVTPAAAQEADANYVSWGADVDENGNNLKRYSHYYLGNNPNDDLEDLGTTFVDPTNQVLDYGEAAHIFSDAPLELGDDFTTTETEYLYDSPLPKTVYTRHVVVDGFGTITNPVSSIPYDCLRMSIEMTIDEYTTDPNTPSSTTTTYHVGWITKEGFRFFAQKPAQNSSGNITFIDGGFTLNLVKTEATLDVELLSFEGKNTEGGRLLTWTTANENNNKGFEIERSSDGKNFEKIGFVKGNGTSKAQYNYTFKDNSPNWKANEVIYYRLQQVDFDGSKVSSNIITLESVIWSKNLKVYPNPTNGNEITLELPENTEGVEVINSLGQIVFSKKIDNIQLLQVDINQWAQGVYFIKSGRELARLVKNN